MADTRRKTWAERMAGYPRLPQVKPVPAALRARRGDGTIAIPSPQEVDAAMRDVPTERLATVFGIGEAIAQAHGATIGCTVTTAIFARMAAHADDEALANAAAPRALPPLPWWRTLKTDGELNANYPGGIAAQKAHLEAEGHIVVQRGRRWFVAGFEHALWPHAKRAR